MVVARCCQFSRGLVGRVARGDVDADARAVRVLADGDDGALGVDAGHGDAVRAVFDGGGDDPGKVRASAGAGQDLGDRLQNVVRDGAHEVRYLGNDMAHGDFVGFGGAEDTALVGQPPRRELRRWLTENHYCSTGIPPRHTR